MMRTHESTDGGSGKGWMERRSPADAVALFDPLVSLPPHVTYEDLTK